MLRHGPIYHFVAYPYYLICIFIYIFLKTLKDVIHEWGIHTISMILQLFLAIEYSNLY